MAMLQVAFPCKTKSYEGCAKEFATAEHFQIVETIDDGNCFFDTLSKAGDRGIVSLQHHHKELRRQLVQYMLAHADEIIPYLSLNNNRSPYERILALEEDGVWDNDDGDMISQIAGDVFLININLFDIKELARPKRYIVNKMPFHRYPGSPTVDILRIHDGHYELLVQLPRNESNANSNHNESNANFSTLNGMTDKDIKKSKTYTVEKLKEILKRLGVQDAKMKGMLKENLIITYRDIRRSLYNKNHNTNNRNNKTKKNNATNLNALMNKLQLGTLTPNEQRALERLL